MTYFGESVYNYNIFLFSYISQISYIQ